MRVVVTGGAGFLGSHLCDAILARGDSAVCVDNLATGRPDNVAHLMDSPGFTFVEADVSLALDVPGPVDAVAHLASPASPPEYLRLPLETLAVGSRGTENALRLAHQHGGRFVLASTSEVYGDPAVHPQSEDYWGNVNPVGPRSVYDEAKRFAEALTRAYRDTKGVNAGIIRIFNTYGPRMNAQDGRIVTNFITQALNGDPLTIYGDGSQTRSFCYVDDLIRGIVGMIDSTEGRPGEPREPGGVHRDRVRTAGAPADRIGLAGGASATPGGRPDPPLPGHHPGQPGAGLAAAGPSGRRYPPHDRVVPLQARRSPDGVSGRFALTGQIELRAQTRPPQARAAGRTGGRTQGPHPAAPLSGSRRPATGRSIRPPATRPGGARCARRAGTASGPPKPARPGRSRGTRATR